MSIDHCHQCSRRVDTDEDCDVYDNPEQKCRCWRCQEEDEEFNGEPTRVNQKSPELYTLRLDYCI